MRWSTGTWSTWYILTTQIGRENDNTPQRDAEVCGVELRGIEPLTSALRTQRSAN